MDTNTNNLAESDGVSIHTGFPNPAIDRQNQGEKLTLDINRLLIKNSSSTYLFRIAGHTWVDSGIFDGDIAVVDRALTPQSSDLVIDWQDSFVIERQSRRETQKQPWGVITAIIHQYDRN